ncbi:hypothetical protein [Nocardiopsis lucentensis]|uniref:hypothetical protein n=1 Tax=Nocardiopsis lucentensis TaxID=53441 RepID=UPI0019D36245|nr:hypothetical protein [Nocardiopsis lucentensis]
MSNRTPLERAMNAHRIKKNLRWKDVLAAADDMAAETLRRVRLHGTDAVDDFTVARLERALQLPPGGLRKMEEEANAAEAQGADPQTAYRAWDGEITGPEGAVEDGELLMWRDTPTGRIYRLADAKDPRFHVEYEFLPGETPEQVIDDLRRLHVSHSALVREMERRRSRT